MKQWLAEEISGFFERHNVAATTVCTPSIKTRASARQLKLLTHSVWTKITFPLCPLKQRNGTKTHMFVQPRCLSPNKPEVNHFWPIWKILTMWGSEITYCLYTGIVPATLREAVRRSKWSTEVVPGASAGGGRSERSLVGCWRCSEVWGGIGRCLVAPEEVSGHGSTVPISFSVSTSPLVVSSLLFQLLLKYEYRCETQGGFNQTIPKCFKYSASSRTRDEITSQITRRHEVVLPRTQRGSWGCSSSRPFAAALPAPRAPSSPAATRTALITASLPLASPLIPLPHTAPGWLAGWLAAGALRERHSISTPAKPAVPHLSYWFSGSLALEHVQSLLSCQLHSERSTHTMLFPQQS